MSDTNGFRESKRWIEDNIKRLSDCVKDLEDKDVERRIEIEALKIMGNGKRTAWGVLGGAIPSISVLIYFILKELK